LQAKAGRLLPGGVGGVTGAGAITGPVRAEVAAPDETAAAGAVEGLHPNRKALRTHRAAARTGE